MDNVQDLKCCMSYLINLDQNDKNKNIRTAKIWIARGYCSDIPCLRWHLHHPCRIPRTPTEFAKLTRKENYCDRIPSKIKEFRSSSWRAALRQLCCCLPRTKLLFWISGGSKRNSFGRWILTSRRAFKNYNIKSCFLLKRKVKNSRPTRWKDISLRIADCCV